MPDPIPDAVRQFLVKNFADVQNEQNEGDYYVFRVKASSALPQWLKVNRYVFTNPDTISNYLQEHKIVAQLENGNAEIVQLEKNVER